MFTLKISSIFISPKTLEWLSYILICHCISLSSWFIILDKNNFVKSSPHYWIPIWASMYSMLITLLTTGLFTAIVMLTHWHVHIFFCLKVIRPWLNLLTGGHGHVICMGDLRGVLSRENTPEGHTETHKSSFFPY